MMENQDFNKELLNYLYDEMTAGEREAFELKMEDDQELKQEYEAMKAVKARLNELPDKEVMEPFPVWSNSKRGRGSIKRKEIIWLRPVTVVAASLLIMMFVGYLTNFSVSINRNGFQFGYGTTNSDQEIKLIDDRIKALVAQEINQSNNLILAKLGASDSTTQLKIAAIENTVANELTSNKSETIDAMDLQNFFSELEKRNSEMLKGYLKLTSNQQQEYFKTMLTQFNDYMQEQRNQDLVMIQNNLIELKETQSIQKKETDQVLTNLFASINYKSSN